MSFLTRLIARERLWYGVQRHISRPIIIGGGVTGLALVAALQHLRRRDDDVDGLCQPVLLEAAPAADCLPGRGTTLRLYEGVCRSLWTSLHLSDDVFESTAFFLPAWLDGSSGARLHRPLKKLSFEHRLISLRHEQLTGLLLKSIDYAGQQLAQRAADNTDDDDNSDESRPEPLLNYGRTAVAIEADVDSVRVTCADGTVVDGDLVVLCCGGKSNTALHPLLQQCPVSDQQAVQVHGVSLAPASWRSAAPAGFDCLLPGGARFSALPSSLPGGSVNWRLSLPVGSPLAAAPVDELLAHARGQFAPFVQELLAPSSVTVRRVPALPWLSQRWFTDTVVVAGGASGQLGAADCFDLDANTAVEDALELASAIFSFNRQIDVEQPRFSYTTKPVFALQMFHARRFGRRAAIHRTSRWLRPTLWPSFNSLRCSPERLAKRIVGNFVPPVFYYEEKATQKTQSSSDTADTTPDQGSGQLPDEQLDEQLDDQHADEQSDQLAHEQSADQSEVGSGEQRTADEHQSAQAQPAVDPSTDDHQSAQTQPAVDPSPDDHQAAQTQPAIDPSPDDHQPDSPKPDDLSPPFSPDPLSHLLTAASPEQPRARATAGEAALIASPPGLDDFVFVQERTAEQSSPAASSQPDVPPRKNFFARTLSLGSSASSSSQAASGEQAKKSARRQPGVYSSSELKEAIELVSKAVSYDERGEYWEAVTYYAMSLPLFEQSLLYETTPERRDVIADKTKEYRTRLGDIETALGALAPEQRFEFFYCTYESFLNPGCLHLTNNSLVFVPKTSSGARVVISLADVASWEKFKTKIVVPCLKIVLKSGTEHVFTSFASRDELIALLQKAKEDDTATAVPPTPSRQPAKPAAEPPGSPSSTGIASRLKSELMEELSSTSLRQAFDQTLAGIIYRTASDMVTKKDKDAPASAVDSSSSDASSSRPNPSPPPVLDSADDPSSAPTAGDTPSSADTQPLSASQSASIVRQSSQSSSSSQSTSSQSTSQSSTSSQSTSQSSTNKDGNDDDVGSTATHDETTTLKYPSEEATLNKLFLLPTTDHVEEFFKARVDGRDEFGIVYVTKRTLYFSTQTSATAGEQSMGHFSLALTDVREVTKETRFFSPDNICLQLEKWASLPAGGDGAVVKLTGIINFDEALYAVTTLHKLRKSLPLVFGTDLRTLLERQGSWEWRALPLTDDQPPLAERVPQLLRECVQFLDNPAADHLSLEGIFRLGEPRFVLDSIADRIDEGLAFANLEPALKTPHLVAGLLKRFLMQMKEPLVPFEYYDLLVATAAIPDPELQLVKMKSIFSVLPPEHLLCLRYLFVFLQRVAARHASNKMTAASLATVFAPLLVRYQGAMSQEILQEIPAIIRLLSLCIEHATTAFSL